MWKVTRRPFGTNRLGRIGITTFSMMSLADPLGRNAFGVLARNHDRVHSQRTAILVLDRDLRLAVRSQVGNRARAADAGQAPGDRVRQHDRHRHQLRRFAAGEAEHQALVAGATPIDTHRDVGRLVVDRGHHRAGVAVESVLGAVVADLADHLAHELGDLDIAVARDLARDDREPGGHQRLARDPAAAGPERSARRAPRPRSGRRSCRGGLR